MHLIEQFDMSFTLIIVLADNGCQGGNGPVGGATTVSNLAASGVQRCAPQGSCPVPSILWVTCCIITFGPAHDSR